MVIYLTLLSQELQEIKDTKVPKSSSFINAFQLIAMSNDLDLSGLFIEEASPCFGNRPFFVKIFFVNSNLCVETS